MPSRAAKPLALIPLARYASSNRDRSAAPRTIPRMQHFLRATHYADPLRRGEDGARAADTKEETPSASAVFGLANASQGQRDEGYAPRPSRWPAGRSNIEVVTRYPAETGGSGTLEDRAQHSSASASFLNLTWKHFAAHSS